MDTLYCINIEKAILSSILFNPDEIEEVSGVLKIEDLYLPAHQKVYQTMIDLYKEELPIDEEFISKRLKSKKFDESILIDILGANPITNLEAYLNEIKEHSKIRQIGELSNNIKKLISDETVSHELITSINKTIDVIEDSGFIKEKKSIQIIEELKKDMELAASNDGIMLGQLSGLKSLDKIIGSFEDGDLIVVAARPSMGKTSFISTVTNNSLQNGFGVLIESLEMPAKKILNRLIASRSGESLSDLKKGLIRNKEKFNEACNFFACENLILHDETYPTLFQLQSRIKRTLRKNPNIKNIFIDHTGKIQLDGKTREDIEIGHITNSLKKIARDFNIRVFLLQQLNRGVEARDNKRPILSDLKNSGNIEEDADMVLGLYRHSYYQSKQQSMFEKPIEDAEIIVLKNRDGETRTAKVAFEGRCARFLDRIEEEIVIKEFKGSLDGL